MSTFFTRWYQLPPLLPLGPAVPPVPVTYVRSGCARVFATWGYFFLAPVTQPTAGRGLNVTNAARV